MSTVTVKTAVERYDFEDYGTLEESGRYVKFEDYAALAAQRDALAAENAALKAAIKDVTDSAEQVEYEGYFAFVVNPDAVHSGVDLIEGETPATDAFLREVRAQGVDMAACALDDVNQFNYANMLDELAQKLRQGGAA